MNVKRIARALLFCPLFLLLLQTTAWAQSKTITGMVTDDKGAAVQGASILATGTTIGTQTDATGKFSLNVPVSVKNLTISYVGFTSQEINITKTTDISVKLSSEGQSNLNEVVVIGYGTAKRRDLAGSFATVSSKSFNQIPSATPDQLLQGKVAGLEVTVNSGQPGAATSVRIRGNNSIRSGTNPLYVVDGVPLDGRSARPTFSGISGLGNTPDANPLTFLNSGDIESISVLKDASASAIYGSRGANGVILITTRTGGSGPLKIDASASVTANDLMRQPDVLSADQYRSALTKYGAKSDSGASYKPFNQILQHKLTQNYSIALSGGGTENSRFRASFLASTTPGIIRKSQLDRYIANANGSYKFLDKKLTITFGITAATTDEQIAPISNNPGSTGSIISNAFQWNPTLAMRRSATDYIVNPNGQVNPLLFSEGYNDHANVTTLLANITAAYKILPSLEYKFLYGVNYSTGNRGNELLGYVSGTGGNNTPDSKGKGGEATIGDAQLFTQTLTHTLTYTKSFKAIDFTALAGYEYYSTSYQTKFSSTYGFDYNNNLNNLLPIHLYDNIQDGIQNHLTSSSFKDPAVDLQSFFGRVQFSLSQKYSLTASIRADGSNKFGKDNRYGYFPAVAAKWNINSEDFLKDSKVISALSLRLGYGETGNSEFPAGAALERYRYNSSGNLGPVNFKNDNLKWEKVTSTDGGIDFGFFKNRLSGSVDVFFKKTIGPLFPSIFAAPAPNGTIYENLPNSYVSNKGGELVLNGSIIETKDFAWKLGGTLEYVRNKFVNPIAGTAPIVLTGQLNGKGTSATYVQAIANEQPIDVFYLRQFHGFDKNGFAITDGTASYAGDPNPRYIVGLSTEVDYKKISLTINMHGAYDYFIYNNTLQSVTGLSFIKNGSNISKTLTNSPENPANPVSASTRYLQSGNYMKLGNATIHYNIGNIGKVVKNLSAYVSGSNLFVLTKYKGFDPEVNVSTLDQNGTGIPSIGIDYVGYPPLRSFTVGLSFSLY